MDSENTKSKSKLRLIIILIIIAIIAAVAIIIFLTRRVKPNPDDALGNSSFNILNGGSFCEYDGHIYFANPADNNRLYVMNSDCTNLKNLNKDSVSNINVYGNHIYYARKTKNFVGRYMTGIARCTLNGHHNESLSPDVVSQMILYGNNLYICASEDKKVNSSYAINVLKKKKINLYEANAEPICIKDNKIYYANPDDNYYIHCYNTKDKSDKLFLKFRAYGIGVTGNTLYFIDIGDNYSLKSFDLTTGNMVCLFKGSKELRCYNYNVWENVVYYAETDSSGSAMYKINADGTNKTLVLTDTIEGIYSTSKYIFVTIVNSEKIYKIPTKGDPVLDTLKVE